MKAPMTETVAKLLSKPTTARKLATAIREAKSKGVPGATVYISKDEQREIGLPDTLICSPVKAG